MKRLLGIRPIIVYVVLAISALTGCGPNTSSEPTTGSMTETPAARGRQIVDAFLKTEAAPYRKMRVRFTIDAEDEAQKVYELESWRKQAAESTTTLSRVVRPAEDSDLGSLTIETKGQKTVVVTHVGSRDEFRETDTNKMFFGGLTAGELLGEWQKYDFGFKAEREIGGQRVHEVEAKLRAGESTVVTRITALFRAIDSMPVEIHSFDNNDREIRTWRIVEIKSDAAGPYAARTEIDNPVYKAKIVVEILGREFPATIDEAVFTRERLKQIAKK